MHDAIPHDILLVAIVALVTAALRFLPFLVFRGDRPIPPLVLRLGRVMPGAAMGMLVIYCLKGVSFASAARFVPALISVVLVAALQVWKRQSLLSILGGTAAYMLLIAVM